MGIDGDRMKIVMDKLEESAAKAIRAIASSLSGFGMNRDSGWSDLRVIQILALRRITYLQIPDWMTHSWFQSALDVTEQDIERFHDSFGAGIEAVTGYPWPTERPSIEDFHGHVASGCVLPLFLAVVVNCLIQVNSRALNGKVYKLPPRYDRMTELEGFVGSDTDRAQALVALGMTSGRTLGFEEGALLEEAERLGIDVPDEYADMFIEGEVIDLLSCAANRGLLVGMGLETDQLITAWHDATQDLSVILHTCSIPTEACIAKVAEYQEDMSRIVQRWNILYPVLVPTASVIENLTTATTGLSTIIGDYVDDPAPAQARLASVMNQLAVAPKDALPSVTEAVAREAGEANAHLGECQVGMERYREIDTRSDMPPRAKRKATEEVLNDIGTHALQGVTHVENGLQILMAAEDQVSHEDPAAPDATSAEATALVQPDEDLSMQTQPSPSPIAGVAEVCEPELPSEEIDQDESPTDVSEEARVEASIDPSIEEPASVPDVPFTTGQEIADLQASISDTVEPEAAEPETGDTPSGSQTPRTMGFEIPSEHAGIEAKARRLFQSREYGLLHHMAEAVETAAIGSLPVDRNEMLVVAAGRRVKSDPRWMIDRYHSAIEACIDVATELRSRPSDWTEARRVALLASVIPVAAFTGDDAQTATQIAETIGSEGACAPFFGLLKAIDENRRKGYPLDAAAIRSLRMASNGDAYAAEARTALRTSIQSLENAKFKFMLGQRVKGWLVTDGPIAEIRSALDAGDMAVLRRFHQDYTSREAIIELLRKGCQELARGGEIDGSARDRMVILIQEIAARTADVHQAVDQIETNATSSRLAMVRDVAQGFVNGYERFLREAPASSDDPLLAAAYDHSRTTLAFMVQTLGGPHAQIDRHKVLDDLQAPLLWLPDLHWAGAWMPTPYDPRAVVQAILSFPSRDVLDDPAGSIMAAYEARVAEGSLVAARMLLDIAGRFQVDPSTIEKLLDGLDDEQVAQRDRLRARHAQVTRMIDRIRRMAIGGIDEAVRLETVTSAIDPDAIPVETPVELMPFSFDDGRLRDFLPSFRKLDEVEAEARTLLDETKVDFDVRLEAMHSSGAISDQERDELAGLLASDELATVSDWMAILEHGGVRPKLLGATVNPQLDRFERHLADGVFRHTASVADDVSSRGGFGPYDLSGRSEEEIASIANALQDWRALRRLATSGKATSDELARAALSVAGAVVGDRVALTHGGASDTVSRGMFSMDVRFPIRPDPESLILPEFGSATLGSWKLTVAGPATSVTDLVAVSQGIEPRGAMILYMGVMPMETRRRLKAECVAKGRRVLVVDEALAIDSLLDPMSDRSAMVVAQAYSAASPYRDYVSSPVPPEMFKGRRSERGRIVDPYGSYIVYGGRRLGKTALLRHIETTGPEHSSFCFVDLRETGSAHFWSHVSAKLSKVFRTQFVDNADDFAKGVRDWLSADERRRILLMLDEADNFVVEQATTGFTHVVRLMNLMADTSHRFKFVLAGLHNVSRIVRTDNSPLSQMSVDPVRVGPLAGGDVGDAELLVRGPLAALGYEFDRREDVWRILSFTNYYPVLAQVFCQGLIRLLDDETLRRGGERFRIDTATVDAALANERIRKGLYESFDKTISHIEQRYELLTYILAERALEDAGVGQEFEGLHVSEIATRAVGYWPEAFPPGSDPSQVDDLLDEMEGFGIIR